MARQADKSSVRQRAFKLMDEHSSLSRADTIKLLMDFCDVQKSYAATLFQSHRTKHSKDKSSSRYTTIFHVRDFRHNKSVSPYIATSVKANPAKGEAKTKEEAITQYIEDNASKSDLAKQL
ncbi:MAG: hypothetical protein KAS32_14925 [Candidatus Peribacteraceae bacterium]|nr:hypothetical protein [Candidatus Peribacteraceae bacterium]